MSYFSFCLRSRVGLWLKTQRLVLYLRKFFLSFTVSFFITFLSSSRSLKRVKSFDSLSLYFFTLCFKMFLSFFFPLFYFLFFFFFSFFFSFPLSSSLPRRLLLFLPGRRSMESRKRALWDKTRSFSDIGSFTFPRMRECAK